MELVTRFPVAAWAREDGVDVEARSGAGTGSLHKPGLVWCSWLLRCRLVLACVVTPPFLDVITGTRSDQTGWEPLR